MKTLAVISLTAFLCCCGVQGAELRDLEQQILNSGTVVFLDFLEKVRNATEKLIRDDLFKKYRIAFQGSLKGLSVFARSLKNDSAGKSQENSDIPLQFFSESVVKLRQMTRGVFDRFLFPYVSVFRETLKKETIKDIWNEVDSYYLPGAPPINSKPMEFLSYLLAKAMVGSRMVNIVQAGVDTIEVIGENDFNQLYEETKGVIHQIRNKTFEISDLEKQKERNNFLVSLRTISGLAVFYLDKVLDKIGQFAIKHSSDSKKQWVKLTQLRNKGEKNHVLDNILEFNRWLGRHLDSDYRRSEIDMIVDLSILTIGQWRTFLHFSILFHGVPVYTLPILKKLSDVGFGVTEINGFLTRAYNITLILEDNDSDRLSTLKAYSRLISDKVSEVLLEESKYSRNMPPLLPLRLVRRFFLECWKLLLMVENNRFSDITDTELEQAESVWNDASTIFINELVKSKAFTKKQLEESPNNFVQAIRRNLEQLKQHTDLANDFDELIDPTVVALKRSMHRINKMLNEFWDLLLE